MIRGQLASNGQALVALTLRGPSGAHRAVSALVDTGFSEFLALPESLITDLGLPYVDTHLAILADNSLVEAHVCECQVLWGDEYRDVLAHQMAGGPVIGMSLLRGHRLTVDVIEGGDVTISALA